MVSIVLPGFPGESWRVRLGRMYDQHVRLGHRGGPGLCDVVIGPDVSNWLSLRAELRAAHVAVADGIPAWLTWHGLRVRYNEVQPPGEIDMVSDRGIVTLTLPDHES